MAKRKMSFMCQECGAEAGKWSGQCAECSEWNCIVEAPKAPSGGRVDSLNVAEVTRLDDIPALVQHRLPTGSKELDRVLGGGLVAGSVVLLGGDPGIGKSTILLQAANHLHKEASALYVTGEESIQQVAMRAHRLGLKDASLQVCAENNLTAILHAVEKHSPAVVIVDSIQTVFTEDLGAAPGSVSQVRECAARLVMMAKRSDVIVVLVGHVTKDGSLAGPRILEHMVDAVLYFEGEKSSRLRLLRAIKNRFGAVNEIGVFAMTGSGLKEVSNPSGVFMSRQSPVAPGSVAFATWEGTRPLIVEVQALVDQSNGPSPRRLGLGLDQNRLSMLLALTHRHAGFAFHDQDVYVNVAGGLKVTEPGIDLAVLIAVLSSFRNQSIDENLVVFGEVGLSGEVRPVQGGLERLKEASKLGFKTALMPFGNQTGAGKLDIKTIPVKQLSEALTAIGMD
ncbi:MAG: DNA repair protein RadA/Sms [Parasphingorhabdus sp.]|jgi:DNA repair protein RadA/Sms